MSLRYPNGAVIKPGFNPVLVPGAPTIGAVTGGDTQVIVAFTAPTDTGGSAITSYQVVSSPGSVVATGASSPITVTGLTNGTAYTFRVAAINSYGAGTFSSASASVTPAIVQGQQAYTTAGTYTWVAPAGVTSVSVVAVGGGGGGSYPGPGGGGGLGYKNNYSVTAGNSYTVVVGVGGTGNPCSPTNGGCSYFVSTAVVNGGGGRCYAGGTPTQFATGGKFTGDGGGEGGGNASGARGGGGAGGYSGNGGNANPGNGSAVSGLPGAACSGAGGSGGSPAPAGYTTACFVAGGGGGGVGILGKGTTGAGGNNTGGGGGAGSSGTNGANSCGAIVGGAGGAYGGGGGTGSISFGTNYTGGNGAVGAVRIIWPGTTRSFPSTNTGNL